LLSVPAGLPLVRQDENESIIHKKELKNPSSKFVVANEDEDRAMPI
jgi:hypothetical protein